MGWGEGAGAGGETFRQIPINALMDHNDDVRRVCDDFTRALKCVCGHCLRSRVDVGINNPDYHIPLHSPDQQDPRRGGGAYERGHLPGLAIRCPGRRCRSVHGRAGRPTIGAFRVNAGGGHRGGRDALNRRRPAGLSVRNWWSHRHIFSFKNVPMSHVVMDIYLNTHLQGIPLLAGAGTRALRPEHDRRGADTIVLFFFMVNLWPPHHRIRHINT